jgi:hypothetical protein
MIAPALLRLTEHVTWVQVPRDTFDLGGVLISSLTLAGICAVIACALGAILGATFIVRNRRQPGLGESALTLHL